VKFDATGFNLPAEHLAMRYAALLLAVLALAGCNTFEDDAQRTNARTTAFAFPAAFTTADARIITERKNPVTGQDVVCTEPSPDVAKAISTAFALSGQGSGGTGSGSGSVATSTGSSEAVAELAGRSTGLLALRDGLFQACQAYANGAIGADMYALIVSRYSQLMTTLFLGQDIAGIPQPVAVAASPSITVNATPPGSGSSPSAGVTTGSSTPPTSLAGTAVTPATGAANAVVRMNEDYLNLDFNAVHTLMVTCINQNDPTTAMPKYSNSTAANPWLTPLCTKLQYVLSSPQGLEELARLSEELKAKAVLATPVDPTSTTVTNFTGPAPKPAAAATGGKSAPTSPSAKKTGGTSAAACVAEPAAEVISALTKLNYLHSGAFGPDNDPAIALATFQADQTPKLTDTCPKGQIGTATLAALTTKPPTPAPAPGAAAPVTPGAPAAPAAPTAPHRP
jgi:hypothetical protein